MNLLILADDLTGALDTGVQFAVRGISTKVVILSSDNLQLPTDAEVVVIDTETRHMKPQAAAAIIANIITIASKFNVKTIYKKTDSALRGNVGPELNAAMTASHSKYLHFLPAFPQMKRTVQHGYLYIDGIPVADSVFGKDPFDPVKDSEIKNIIRPYTRHVSTAETFHPGLPDGIIIYNSASLQDMLQIGLSLKKHCELRVLAGCAGFASLLPDLLDLPASPVSVPICPPSLLVICGSINPISTLQISRAASNGFAIHHLSPLHTAPNWFYQDDGILFLRQLLQTCLHHPYCALDTAGITGSDAKKRLIISHSLGYISKWLLEQEIPHTLLITGGDTLLAFMHQLHISSLQPLRELMPGVVLFTIDYQGRSHYLLSKSGGFGPPDLLIQLTSLLTSAPAIPTRKEQFS